MGSQVLKKTYSIMNFYTLIFKFNFGKLQMVMWPTLSRITWKRHSCWDVFAFHSSLPKIQNDSFLANLFGWKLMGSGTHCSKIDGFLGIHGTHAIGATAKVHADPPNLKEKSTRIIQCNVCKDSNIIWSSMLAH